MPRPSGSHRCRPAMKPRPAGRFGIRKTGAPSAMRTTSIVGTGIGLTKETHAPSGEISGRKLRPGAMIFASVPSARIFQMPGFAPLNETYAIVEPSRESDGFSASAPSSEMRRGALPSPPAPQIS